MTIRISLLALMLSVSAFAQVPPIEPGVSQELAKWRAARYSNVRYKLNLTLEKMSPVLKGSMEIRVNVSEPPASAGGQKADDSVAPIVLDWRRIKGHEEKSVVSNVSVNGRVVSLSTNWPPADAGGSDFSEHLIFSDGVVMGENVIKLDFMSPILTSGSAITRYVDKEDGSEYLYSLFVPSDASTAFPVFDQPDIKARFTVTALAPSGWNFITNTHASGDPYFDRPGDPERPDAPSQEFDAPETKPISTYVFAFAAGPFERVEDPASRSVPPAVAGGLTRPIENSSGSKPAFRTEMVIGDSVGVGVSNTSVQPPATAGGTDIGERVSNPSVSSPRVSKGARGQQAHSLTVGLQTPETTIYVRKSQAAKFKPHAAEVFRLNREAIKYFEEYFDYKFPFPKYDLVLIPEFPFGGMEHAGATFLRESSIIFPQEPTKNDHISRATLMFHEASHQWFGDTVTMRWFDDLWLKEGFATFTAYKAMERVMPEMNAWKVFYERVKQAAYQTDSTRGTTAIYQPIANLSAAKSAYGNIVYNKAPAFLRQAEFYLGEDKFQTAVRAFLKKHEFGNAGWEDLVREFEIASEEALKEWANGWVVRRGLARFRTSRFGEKDLCIDQTPPVGERNGWRMKLAVLKSFSESDRTTLTVDLDPEAISPKDLRNGIRKATCYSTNHEPNYLLFLFPNYQDYGYGIFLLDEKSREYVLKNIQNEKDPFLRSMMWGALWDSVREGELDPGNYVELAITNIPSEQDETIVSSILNRVGTAMNYYLSDKRSATIALSLETVLFRRILSAATPGERSMFLRALIANASTTKGREMLKDLFVQAVYPEYDPTFSPPKALPDSRKWLTLRTKDRFDLVTRLAILGDKEAPKLLADLEKTETGDDAKRYAYAARAGIGTAENKAKYWNDFVNNKEISESWIEAAFGPWNSIRHSELTLPYLERALKELPNHKRSRKIFFVNGWLGAFIGGQRSEEALAIVNKFLADNPSLDNDLRLKILENVDVIERAVRIRKEY